MPRLTAASSPDLSATISPRLAHFPPWTSGSVARGCPPRPLALRSPPPLRNRHRRSHRPREDGPSEGPHRSEEHTSELQSQSNLVCRLLLEKTRRKYYRQLTATYLLIRL